MRIIGAAAVTLFALAACGPAASGGTGTGGGPSASAAERPVASAAASSSAVPTANVPDLVGMGLQSAQDRAQAAGFASLSSHDSLGRDRVQILDRDWKVCFQRPPPGRHPTDTTIDLGAVKLEEQCPAKDASTPAAAGGTMPNFAGRSVKAARAALDSSTSISVHDVSGQDRVVLLESNWRVCSQSPAPGTTLNGQPVMLKAVKFGESCP